MYFDNTHRGCPRPTAHVNDRRCFAKAIGPGILVYQTLDSSTLESGLFFFRLRLTSSPQSLHPGEPWSFRAPLTNQKSPSWCRKQRRMARPPV